MKQKWTRSFSKWKLLILIIGLLLFNCQPQENLLDSELVQKELSFKTVQFSRAYTSFKFFEDKNSNLIKLTGKSSDDNLEIDPNWESYSQEPIEFTNSFLGNVETEINVTTNLDIRLIFLDVNEQLIQVIESVRVEELFENGSLKKGTVFYHKFDGRFIDAYKVNDGVVVKRLLPEIEIDQASLFSFLSLLQEDCDEDLDPNSEFCDNDLEEIIIETQVSYGTLYFFINLNPIEEIATDGDDDNTGGGGSNDGDGAEVNVDNVPPSCESFDYTMIGGTNWQVAAVSGIRELFYVFNWECTGFDYGHVPQALYFQLPVNFVYSLNSGYTKTESAAALHEAFKSFDAWYKNNACSSSYAVMTNTFVQFIKDEFEELGGNVTLTPPNGFTGVIKKYKSTWNGYGNCN